MTYGGRRGGNLPVRPLPRQAQAPQAAATPSLAPTSSSFLALPVTNTTLRRAGAAMLSPLAEPASHRRRRPRAPLANGKRLPPSYEGNIRSCEGGLLPLVTESLARGARGAMAAGPSPQRPVPRRSPPPHRALSPPQAPPTAGTGTSGGAGTAVPLPATSLFTSPAFGSRGWRILLPIFP